MSLISRVLSLGNEVVQTGVSRLSSQCVTNDGELQIHELYGNIGSFQVKIELIVSSRSLDKPIEVDSTSAR